MATPPLVIDDQAVIDAPLDGLLGGFHHLCEAQTQGSAGAAPGAATAWAGEALRGNPALPASLPEKEPEAGR